MIGPADSPTTARSRRSTSRRARSRRRRDAHAARPRARRGSLLPSRISRACGASSRDARRARARRRRRLSRACRRSIPRNSRRPRRSAARSGRCELRAVGDAVAAAAAAHAAARRARHRRARADPRAVRRCATLHGSSPTRSTSAAPSSIAPRPALGRIRRGLAQAQHDARDRVGAIVRSAKYAKAIQDPVVTIREGRFVVPIKAEFSGEFPGIVHDTSSSGQTLFVEPLAALETNNRAAHAADRRRARGRARARGALAARRRARGADRSQRGGARASLDLLVAKAQRRARDGRRRPRAARRAGACRSCAGRHPLLGDRAVPQTLAARRCDAPARHQRAEHGRQDGRAQDGRALRCDDVLRACSCPRRPARASGVSSTSSPTSATSSRSRRNASTFSAHLARMREMLERADERTLLSSTRSAAAPSPAPARRWRSRCSSGCSRCGARGDRDDARDRTQTLRARGARRHERQRALRSAHVRARPSSSTSERRASRSRFRSRARSASTHAIVERARAPARSRERDYEAALAELALRSVGTAARARRPCGRTSGSRRERGSALGASAPRSTLKSARLASARRNACKRRCAISSRELQRRAAERERARPKVTAAQSASLSRAVEAMRDDLGISAAAPAAEDARRGFAAGDRVRVPSLAQNGAVVEDYGETVLVAIGQMKTVVRQTRSSQRTGETSARTPGRGGGSAKLEAATRTTAELDVRGKRYVEAEPLVDAGSTKRCSAEPGRCVSSTAKAPACSDADCRSSCATIRRSRACGTATKTKAPAG